MYRDPRHVAFIRLLRDRGVADVAALRTGGQVVAVHVGLRHGGRFSSWIPAFDADFRAYAPGRLLLEHLMAAGHSRGATRNSISWWATSPTRGCTPPTPAWSGRWGPNLASRPPP